jgi:hypothetical protein
MKRNSSAKYLISSGKISPNKRVSIIKTKLSKIKQSLTPKSNNECVTPIRDPN